MSEHASFDGAESIYGDDTEASSGRGAVRIASVAALGGFLFGYDSAVINGAVTAIEDEFTVSTPGSVSRWLRRCWPPARSAPAGSLTSLADCR